MDISAGLLSLDHHILALGVLANVQDDMIGILECTKELDIAGLALLICDPASVAIPKLAVCVSTVSQVNPDTLVKGISDESAAIQAHCLVSRAGLDAASVTSTCSKRWAWRRFVSTAPASCSQQSET